MVIPDHLLSNGGCVNNYNILESQSFGGSDHRPLLFNIPTTTQQVNGFQRWNIRKFVDNNKVKQYLELLQESLQGTQHKLNNVDNVENAWMVIKSWILAAVDKSVGILKFYPSTRREFLTPELSMMLKKVEEKTATHAELLKNNAPRRLVNIVHSSIVDLNREIRVMADCRRKEVFCEVINDFSNPQNMASTMKNLNCWARRKSKQMCKLDANKLDDYVEHFGTTFGGLPLGGTEEFNIDDPEYVPTKITTAQFEAAIIDHQKLCQSAPRNHPVSSGSNLHFFLPSRFAQQFNICMVDARFCGLYKLLITSEKNILNISAAHTLITTGFSMQIKTFLYEAL